MSVLRRNEFEERKYKKYRKYTIYYANHKQIFVSIRLHQTYERQVRSIASAQVEEKNIFAIIFVHMIFTFLFLVKLGFGLSLYF